MRKFSIILVTILLSFSIFYSLTLANNVQYELYYQCGCQPPDPANPNPPSPTPSQNYPHCKPDCVQCLKDGGAYTALGCIPEGAGGVVNFLLRFAVGMGGGAAFLFMVGGAFKVMTSGGDPGRLSSGKNMISGGILGILVIVFATVILRVIGYDILRVPGFGK
jgi:hypothetical protein